jgi:ribonuclease HI
MQPPGAPEDDVEYEEGEEGVDEEVDLLGEQRQGERRKKKAQQKRTQSPDPTKADPKQIKRKVGHGELPVSCGAEDEIWDDIVIKLPQDLPTVPPPFSIPPGWKASEGNLTLTDLTLTRPEPNTAASMPSDPECAETTGGQRQLSTWPRPLEIEQPTSTPPPSDTTACGDIQPNPGPVLNCLQWNCRTMDSTRLLDALAELKERHGFEPDIVALQEIRRTRDEVSKIKIPGYFISATSTKAHRSGGTAILTKTDAPFLVEALPPTAEEDFQVAAVNIHLEDRSIAVSSVYVQPRLASIVPALAKIPTTQYSLVMGDFNAHNARWDQAALEESRGEELVEWADALQLCTLNDPTVATRPRPTVISQNPTSPDVTLMSGMKTVFWGVHTAIKSDHGYIIMSIDTNPEILDPDPEPSRGDPRWTLKKADWELFGKVVKEELYGKKPTRDPNRDIKTLNAAILAAAHASIPRGKYQVENPMRNVVTKPEIMELSRQIEALDPVTDRETLQTLHSQRNDLVHAELRRQWSEKVSTLKPGDTHAWRTLKAVGAPPPAPTNSALKLPDGSVTTSPKEKANAFLRHYRNVAGVQPPPPKVPCTSIAHPVTMAETLSAVHRLANGKAAGPDGILPEFLKHLPRVGMKWLHRIIATSFETGKVPDEWKLSTIVPIPKPGKDLTQAVSYRPVALTSVIAKVAERVIAERLLHQIGHKLHESQFGFRKTRSTGDAINLLIEEIARRFGTYVKVRRPAGVTSTSTRTMAVFYDLTGAFERVDQTKLMKKLQDMSVDDHCCRWIRNFLAQRPARVKVGCTMSQTRKFYYGVPQGTILGPLLWCVYIDDLLQELGTLPRDDNVAVCYADDLTAAGFGPTAEQARDNSLKADRIIRRWCDNNNMRISTKSESALFTRAFQDFDTDLRIADIPLANYTAGTRLLGVMLSSKLDFHHHIDKLVDQSNKRINQLRALGATKYGPSTHSLRTFYKGYIESLLLNGCEAWWPLLSDTQKDRVRTIQRKALRVVTGCLASTPASSLFLEANVAPIDDLIEHRMARKLERDRRYPEGDVRLSMAGNQPPRAQGGLGAGRALALTRTPLMAATEALEGVVPPADREPNLGRLPMAPWETLNAYRIVISKKTDTEVQTREGLPMDLKVAEKEAKRKATRDTIRRWRTAGRTRPAREYWTDASVNHAQMKSAGVAVRFHKNRTFIMARRCGTIACSYRAEQLALALAVDNILELAESKEIPPRSRVLLCTDSQSMLASLETGPLNQGEQENAFIWRKLLRIADLGFKVVLQFVYSHCGVERNEMADRLAGEYNSSLPELDPTPTWLTDLCSRKKLSIRERRRNVNKLHGHQRETEFEARPTPLQSDAPRSDSVRLARIRTGESLEYGSARRRLLWDQSMMCRWCHPEAHPKPPPEQQAVAPPATLPTRSTDPHKCPICGVQKSNLRHCRDHIRTEHGPDMIPPGWESQRSNPRRVARPPAEEDEPLICPHCHLEKPRPTSLSALRGRLPSS